MRSTSVANARGRVVKDMPPSTEAVSSNVGDSGSVACLWASSSSASLSRYSRSPYSSSVVPVIGMTKVFRSHVRGRSIRARKRDMRGLEGFPVSAETGSRTLVSVSPRTRMVGDSMRTWTSGSPSGLRICHTCCAGETVSGATFWPFDRWASGFRAGTFVAVLPTAWGDVV